MLGCIQIKERNMEIANDLKWIVFWAFVFGYMACAFTWIFWPRKKKKKKSKFPRCSCKDVNQCSTWCYAKEALKKDSQNGLL